MNESDVKKGITYYGEKDRTQHGLVSHLRFVISDFVFDDITNDERALVVNMTEWNIDKRNDNTCILRVGEHPEITKESFIAYQHAEKVSKKYILENINSKKFIQKKDISPELLERIQEGAKNSDLIPEFAEDFFDYF